MEADSQTDLYFNGQTADYFFCTVRILQHPLLMELRGIEPLSESPSIKVSPITVDLYSFPRPLPGQQGKRLSSFMILLLSQSFDSKGPRIL